MVGISLKILARSVDSRTIGAESDVRSRRQEPLAQSQTESRSISPPGPTLSAPEPASKHQNAASKPVYMVAFVLASEFTLFEKQGTR